MHSLKITTVTIVQNSMIDLGFWVCYNDVGFIQCLIGQFYFTIGQFQGDIVIVSISDELALPVGMDYIGVNCEIDSILRHSKIGVQSLEAIQKV